MTNSDSSETTESADGVTSIQDEQRVDEASGQKVGPPGQGDLDRDKLEKGTEDLDKAGGGH